MGYVIVRDGVVVEERESGSNRYVVYDAAQEYFMATVPIDACSCPELSPDPNPENHQDGCLILCEYRNYQKAVLHMMDSVPSDVYSASAIFYEANTLPLLIANIFFRNFG